MKTAKQLMVLIQMKMIWPSLPDQHGATIADGTYLCPTRAEVEAFLQGTWFEKYVYTLERFDCDNFAKVFAAFVEQERAKSEGPYQWALGEMRGKFKHGPDGGHAMNFCLTADEGMVLIEPQNDGIVPADPADDIWAYWL